VIQQGKPAAKSLPCAAIGNPVPVLKRRTDVATHNERDTLAEAVGQIGDSVILAGTGARPALDRVSILLHLLSQCSKRETKA
jgi:hypothetical protein